MKRKLIFLNILFFSTIRLYCFNLFSEYEIDPSRTISLEQNSIATIISYDGEKKVTKFELEQKGKILFLNFLNNDIFYDGDKVTQVLLLVGKQIEGDYDRNFTIGFFENDKWFIKDLPRSMEGYNTYKDCTSSLKEGDKNYTIENLSEIRIDSPWVEGVEGYGEGEGFTIVGNKKYLLIVNGFISINKPYLYEYNSRVKELRIIGSKSGKTKITKLIDTPNPQTVDISFLEDSDDTIVRIESVYKGTKYQDTCLSLCKLHDKEVIPYLGD